MYRRSTAPTASTSIHTSPREVLTLDPQLIVNTIHSALTPKIFKNPTPKNFAALKSFAARLSQRVKTDVYALIPVSATDPTTDWEVTVFRSIIATFPSRRT
ncbi:hypothetical protein PtrSN002B_011771 [Pyrenophora tritici-repentis]|uniref:Uncharacterized protein n=1 Tax=Pyrenophora tritici-repentis TaxID=45151 RepID=A0A2W1CQU1_9PLEO|nr:hypothetical protein PtrV1_11409 [Pyrenophora tritici-repentis]KAF7444211.1 hypothetical protein A1F99_107640 [Pyrenophora tritici-repentis]KAF7565161.1 hypothetical protein PtrM4_045950 [Pyrenophora tritici-repentis]KAG9385536.1 hypothetical protein A1F94_005083 [Pyrenophora tritici-repentis]KAI0570437.1 hypothetical protein Alg215_11050 [Pyrenophora tritici-repentis]